MTRAEGSRLTDRATQAPWKRDFRGEKAVSDFVQAPYRWRHLPWTTQPVRAARFPRRGDPRARRRRFSGGELIPPAHPKPCQHLHLLRTGSPCSPPFSGEASPRGALPPSPPPPAASVTPGRDRAPAPSAQTEAPPRLPRPPQAALARPPPSPHVGSQSEDSRDGASGCRPARVRGDGRRDPTEPRKPRGVFVRQEPGRETEGAPNARNRTCRIGNRSRPSCKSRSAGLRRPQRPQRRRGLGQPLSRPRAPASSPAAPPTAGPPAEATAQPALGAKGRGRRCADAPPLPLCPPPHLPATFSPSSPLPPPSTPLPLLSLPLPFLLPVSSLPPPPFLLPNLLPIPYPSTLSLPSLPPLSPLPTPPLPSASFPSPPFYSSPSPPLPSTPPLPPSSPHLPPLPPTG
ncbi:uncharacterized protein LOC135364613 [Mirounga angustirostris]|uniref:uncharacterized protein LOC135364613 n=1 Tax=Mirounga angustirostris TaxID=9716 RepID=UPI00313E6CA7